MAYIPFKRNCCIYLYLYNVCCYAFFVFVNYELIEAYTLNKKGIFKILLELCMTWMPVACYAQIYVHIKKDRESKPFFHVSRWTSNIKSKVYMKNAKVIWMGKHVWMHTYNILTPILVNSTSNFWSVQTLCVGYIKYASMIIINMQNSV